MTPTPEEDRRSALFGLLLPILIVLATAAVLVLTHVHGVNAVKDVAVSGGAAVADLDQRVTRLEDVQPASVSVPPPEPATPAPSTTTTTVPSATTTTAPPPTTTTTTTTTTTPSATTTLPALPEAPMPLDVEPATPVMAPVMSGCANEWAPTSRRDLAEAALGLLDIATTEESVSLLLVQFHAEGGGSNNTAWFNPANVSSEHLILDAVAVRGNHALVFPNCHVGAVAFAKTLGKHYYDDVRVALAAGDRDRWITVLAASPWAGSHYAVVGRGPGSLLRGISDAAARGNGGLLISGPEPS